MTSRTTVAAVLAAAVLAGTAASAQRGPAAAAARLPADVLALACAPRPAFDQPDTPLRVTGGQESFVKRNHYPGDLVTINAGSEQGIQAGQEYYTRRLITRDRQRVSQATPATVATSGWIRIYAVDDRLSLATITHACDTVEIGDHLEPFALPVVPAVSAEKPKPERDNYGRVLTGADHRRLFGTGDFFLLDRGANFGIAPGAQFVLYRNTQQPENFLYELGEAVAVDVNATTATLRVTLVRDAIQEGDLVAIRK